MAEGGRRRLRRTLGACALLVSGLLVIGMLLGDRLTRERLVASGDGTLPDSAWGEALRFTWREAGNLSEDAGVDEGAPSFAPGAPDLYFTRHGPGGADLFRRRWTPHGYGPAEPLFELNSSADDVDPMPAPDGRSILFASNRPGGAGGYDLYSAPVEGESFGPPQPLGPAVNGPADERHPAPDPVTGGLVLASNRLAVDGTSYDLFELPPSAGGPAEPVLLDPLKSPEGSESRAPAFSPDGRFLVFTSDRSGTGYDLYRTFRFQGRWQPPQPLASLNTELDETDPAFTPEGRSLAFARTRPDGDGLATVLRLARCEELQVLHREGEDFWGLLLYILAALLAAMALTWLVLKWGELHPFVKFVLLSLLVHMLIMMLVHTGEADPAPGGDAGETAFAVTLLATSQDAASREDAAQAAHGDRVQAEPARASPASVQPPAAPVEAPAAPATPAAGQGPTRRDAVRAALPEGAAAPARSARRRSAQETARASEDAFRRQGRDAPLAPARSSAQAVRAPGQSPAPHAAPSAAAGPEAAPETAPGTVTAMTRREAPAAEPVSGHAGPRRRIRADRQPAAPAHAGRLVARRNDADPDLASPGSPDAAAKAPAPRAPRDLAEHLQEAPPPRGAPGDAPGPRHAVGPARRDVAAGAALPRIPAPRSGGHAGPRPRDMAALQTAGPGRKEISRDLGLRTRQAPAELDTGRPGTPAAELARVQRTTASAPRTAAADPHPSSTAPGLRPVPSVQEQPAAARSRSVATTTPPTPHLVSAGRDSRIPARNPASTGAPRRRARTFTGSRHRAAVAAIRARHSRLRRGMQAPGLEPAPRDLLPRRRVRVGRQEPAGPAVYARRTGPARLEALEKAGGSAGTERAVMAGLRYLAEHQQPGGAWGRRTRDDKYGDVRIGKTGLALLAFLGSGYTQDQPGPFQDTVQRALGFLLDRQHGPTGHIGRCAAYGHGIATYALAEAYAMTRDRRLHRPLRRAVARILDAQVSVSGSRRHGGWSYFYRDPQRTFDPWPRLSVTVWQVMALESARIGGLEVPDRALVDARSYLLGSLDPKLDALRYNHDPEWLRNAYPTLPGSTSAGLFACGLLGVPRDHPARATALRYVNRRLPRGGWEQPSTRDFASRGDGNEYFLYYATLGLRLEGGEDWHRWNAALKPLLVESQEENGSWRPISPYADYARDRHDDRCYTTAMCVLMLEVYYRYDTPLLQELAGDLQAAAEAAAEETPSPGGLVVQAVRPGTSAAAAGLRPGDRILMLGGASIHTFEDLARAARTPTATGSTPLQALRDGRRVTLHVAGPLAGLSVLDTDR